jgi:hypothetical protein
VYLEIDLFFLAREKGGANFFEPLYSYGNDSFCCVGCCTKLSTTSDRE